jgi:hypothetical protein
MSTITASTAIQTAVRTRVPTWRSGITTGVVAATVTSVVVAGVRAAGIPLDAGGEPIPFFGFAQMVLLGTVIGIVMARRMRRSTFVRATVVLTAVSCIPSVALGTGVASKLGLVFTHMVAAAIVIPWFARQLSD